MVLATPQSGDGECAGHHCIRVAPQAINLCANRGIVSEYHSIHIKVNDAILPGEKGSKDQTEKP